METSIRFFVFAAQLQVAALYVYPSSKQFLQPPTDATDLATDAGERQAHITVTAAMGSLEQAVSLVFNPTADPAVKAQASAFLDQWKTQPDSWKVCVQQILTSATAPPQVTFWCMQLIQEVIQQRLAQIDASDRAALRNAFLQYLRDVNKFAQCIVLLAKFEYPEEWPSFFHDLLGMAQTGVPALVDMFFRILNTVDDEIASLDFSRPQQELQRNAQIKNAMRHTSVPALVDAWYTILLGTHASAPDLAKACLTTLARYVAWIDIGLVATERFVQLFFTFLSSPQLRDEAADCLLEMVGKGMDPVLKASLIERLRLIEVIRTIAPKWGDDSAKLSTLAAQGVGLELLGIIDKLMEKPGPGTAEVVETCEKAVVELIPIVFQFMESEDDDVSSAALPFVHAYVAMVSAQVKKGAAVSALEGEHFQKLLAAIARKLQYDETYSFEREGEEEAEFQEFRKDLATVFKNVARLAPELAKSFVYTSAAGVCQQLASLPFAPVEAALALVYQLGEALTEEALSKDAAFAEVLGRIVLSNVAGYPHRAVQLMFFENAVRYYKTLGQQAAWVQATLQAFLDDRGVRHASPHVRSRAAYLFLRLAKSLRTSLAPYTGTILQGIQDLLAVSAARAAPRAPGARLSAGKPEGPIPDDDQVNLYEAVGQLLGSDICAPDQQAAYLSAIIGPVLELLAQVAASAAPGDFIGAPHVEALVCHVVTAAVGGGVGSRRDASWGLFTRFLEAVLRVSVALRANEAIHQKVIFLLHRMVDVLGPDVVAYLPGCVSHLLSNCSVKDLLAFLALYNQLVIKFKAALFPVVNESILVLVRRVVQATQGTPAAGAAAATAAGAPSEEERERAELQRAYFTLLCMLVQNGLDTVLTSPGNVKSLNDVLGTLVAGCSHPDPAANRQCLLAMLKLIELWGGPNEASRCPGFNQFVVEQMAPAALRCPMRPAFNLADAVANQVVGDALNVLKAAWVRIGQPIAQHFAERVLPGLPRCDAAAAAEFLAAIQAAAGQATGSAAGASPEGKLARNWFKSFIEKRRG
eukprot:tig00001027_g6388.t1